MARPGEEEDDLGRELWNLMEEPQGFGFVADDVVGADEEYVLAVAERARKYMRIAAGRLDRFLKRHAR